MMSLSDAGSDLRWVVTNLTFQSSEIQSSRLKHISLPVCPNKPVRDAYKSALTGMFGMQIIKRILSLCVRVCVCVCMRACVCARACVCVHVCVRACMSSRDVSILQIDLYWLINAVCNVLKILKIHLC